MNILHLNRILDVWWVSSWVSGRQCAKMHGSNTFTLRPNAACMMNRRFLSFGLFCARAWGWILFVKHYALGVPPASCSLNPVPWGGSSESPILPAQPTAPVQHPRKHAPGSPLLPLPQPTHKKRAVQCVGRISAQGTIPAPATAWLWERGAGALPSCASVSPSKQRYNRTVFIICELLFWIQLLAKMCSNHKSMLQRGFSRHWCTWKWGWGYGSCNDLDPQILSSAPTRWHLLLGFSSSTVNQGPFAGYSVPCFPILCSLLALNLCLVILSLGRLWCALWSK